MGTIYKIKNLINNKQYIGITARDVNRRWYEHIHEADNGNKRYPIHYAIQKYGVENFSFEILETCEEKDLAIKEQFYIQKYNTYIGNGKGYNATLGGEGNVKIDRTNVKNLWNEGKACCDIAKELNSSSNTICKIVKEFYPDASGEIKSRSNLKVKEFHSKPIKQYDIEGNFIAEFPSIKSIGKYNISRAVLTGIKSDGFYWIGEDSPYTIEELVKGERKNPRCKKVAQYTIEGEYICTYNSLKEAKNATGASKITDVCKGNRKTSGGYIWKYV